MKDKDQKNVEYEFYSNKYDPSEVALGWSK